MDYLKGLREAIFDPIAEDWRQGARALKTARTSSPGAVAADLAASQVPLYGVPMAAADYVATGDPKELLSAVPVTKWAKGLRAVTDSMQGYAKGRRAAVPMTAAAATVPAAYGANVGEDIGVATGLRQPEYR